MKKINWKVRFANKVFWFTFVPALFALLAKVLELFGVHFEYGTLEAQICDIIEGIFVVLGILGIVNDPTTAGVSDSDLAMTYEEPKA
jgi:phi LC3 family holin